MIKSVTIFLTFILINISAFAAEVKPSPAQNYHPRKSGSSSVCPYELNKNWKNYLLIDQLYVGQGDSAFIRTPNGTTVLIDGGDLGKGESEILPKLLKCYSEPGRVQINSETGLPQFTIDYLVVTHPHTDHFAGLMGLLGNPYKKTSPKLKIKEATIVPEVMPKDASTSWKNFKAAVEYSGSKMIAPKLGVSTIQDANGAEKVIFNILVSNGVVAKQLDSKGDVVNTAKVDGVIDSKSGEAEDGNAVSIGILVSYKNFKFLTTGDISGGGKSNTPDVETPLSLILPEVDVYKSSHHGSETSNNQTLMNKIKPKAVLVSVGIGGPNGNADARNKIGHRLPDRAAVERMAGISSKPHIFMTSCGETQENPDENKLSRWPLTQKMPGIVHDLKGDILVMSNGSAFSVDGSVKNAHWMYKKASSK